MVWWQNFPCFTCLTIFRFPPLRFSHKDHFRNDLKTNKNQWSILLNLNACSSNSNTRKPIKKIRRRRRRRRSVVWVFLGMSRCSDTLQWHAFLLGCWGQRRELRVPESSSKVSQNSRLLTAVCKNKTSIQNWHKKKHRMLHFWRKSDCNFWCLCNFGVFVCFCYFVIALWSQTLAFSL